MINFTTILSLLIVMYSNLSPIHSLITKFRVLQASGNADLHAGYLLLDIFMVKRFVNLTFESRPMRRFFAEALLCGQKFYHRALRKFKNDDEVDLDSEEREALSQSADRIFSPESTDDESSAVRLSRRSSVLVDLISLFRRSSSSTCRAPRLPGQELAETHDEEEAEEEDPKHMSKERVLEAIRQKKEAIIRLRSQPWSMKRKRRTLKHAFFAVARRYLKRQQSKVSRWHLYKVEAVRRWTAFGRWCSNMKIYLIPWEAKIKMIESHYGSVVSSYFTFLRWVLSVNITMTVIMMLFVTIPEWLADSRGDPERLNRTYHIKVMKDKDVPRADELNTVLDFKGYFEYSLLFYGYYSSETYFGDTVQYSVPVAYFTVNLFILGYSFFVILRKMASNARQSKLAGGKAEQYVFNWKLFAGWDYSIGNPETAGNVVMANVNKFREVIAEYNVNRKKKFDCLQFTLRIIANILVLTMQAGSVWAILAVSQITTKTTFIQRNAVSITVSFITLTFPNFFDLISKIERYHPRTTLRLQLGRVLFLYILNYYTLIISLMFMLNTMESQRSGGEQLIPVAHYSGQHQVVPISNSSYYEIVRHRPGRQVVFDLPSDATSLFNRSKFNDIPTTPPPGKPWTTVFPNFGPLGVTNPKAVVTENRRGVMNASTFITYPIGKIDWSKNVTAKPTLLNYSSTVRAVSSARLSTDWYEECWENLIGQEITKLVTTDLVMTIASILVIDFFRALWVRYTNIWWFWNLETTFPEYGEFKVAENVLHLVNNQGMIWLGLFFVPMLPAINNIKLIILMYVRGWAVMTCNVPARQIFRASRSSNFYLMLLLLMLFLCTLPVGYVIASKKPSKICGPFGSQDRFYSVIVQLLDRNLTKGLVDAIRYMTSPGIVIPVLLLLLLTIYFLFALVRGLREANTDLTKQLMHERTEEKKKIFELAGGGKKRSNIGNNGGHRSLPNKSRNSSSSSSPSKSSNITDDEFSSDKSYRRSNKELHTYVPSLKSVSEAERSESDEIVEEQTVQLQQQQQQQSDLEAPPPKRGWKQKILTWLGLDERPKKQRKRIATYTREDIETGDESPVSGKKSTTEPGTSEDQRSMTSITESYSHSSPSFHDCASAPERILASSSSPDKVIHDEETATKNGSYHTAESDPARLQEPIPKLKHSSRSQPAFEACKTTTEVRPVSLLEPLKGDRERSLFQLQPGEFEIHGNEQEQQQNRRSKASSSSSSSHRSQGATSPKHGFFDLTDPRLSYANPYSSYANAMMSPLMEMQALTPTAYSDEEVEEEDEFRDADEKTQLLDTSNNRKISREKSTKRDRKRGRPTMDARPNEKSDTLVLEMEPVDANVIVHSTVCEPVLRPHPASAQKGKMKQRGQNSAQSGEEGQTKLGRVEARAFLRDVRPEAAQLPEDNQRPHVVSDLEPRMLVVGAEPRTYYADAEGAPTSHDEPLNLRSGPSRYTVPYYARMQSAQEAAEKDASLQQFLMRVSVSEDHSSSLPRGSSPKSSRPPPQLLRNSSTEHSPLATSRQQQQRPMSQKPPNRTPKSRHKHTFV